MILFAQADQLWVHPEYDAILFKNDVAMLHLATPLKFGRGIKAIPFDKHSVASEMDCVIVGWGDTKLTNGTCI